MFIKNLWHPICVNKFWNVFIIFILSEMLELTKSTSDVYNRLCARCIDQCNINSGTTLLLNYKLIKI